MKLDLLHGPLNQLLDILTNQIPLDQLGEENLSVMLLQHKRILQRGDQQAAEIYKILHEESLLNTKIKKQE